MSFPRLTRLGLAIALATTVACERAERPDPDRCGRQAGEFRSWFQDLVREGYGRVPLARISQPDIAVDANQEVRPVGPESTVLEVSPEGIYVSSELVTTPDHLDRDPGELVLALKNELGPGKKNARLRLHLAKTASFGTVRSVLRATRDAGWSKIGVLVRAPVKQSAPNVDDLPPLFDRWSEGAFTHREMFAKVYENCPKVLDLMGNADSDAYGARTWLPAFQSAIADSLASCGCDVDLPQARAAHWIHSGRTQSPHYAVVSLEAKETLQNTGDLQAALTWEQAAGTVFARR